MPKAPVVPIAVLAAALSLGAGQTVKRAVFAGQFYPAEAARLAADVDEYMAAGAAAAPAPGRLLALIAPHAGYMYSGRTAGAAYAQAVGREIDTVVIVGPSHRLGFDGCSIWPDGGFETPLGVARVDSALAAELARAAGFRFRPEAFAEEHSVEVQVPFVQRALPGASIVPVVMGRQTRKTIRAFAEALARTCLDKKVLVVASTDLSHFLPKAEARAADAATAGLVRAMDADSLIRKAEAGENIMCGGGPVAAVLLLAERAGRPRAEILSLTDSSAFGGPVVGYLAAAVFSGAGAEAPPFSLSREDKVELLRVARTAVAEFVVSGAVIEDRSANPNFRTPRGVFVTLRKDGRLRGCVGFVEPAEPLGRALIEAAICAATEDPRFPPVSPAELGSLSVEVSVLTPVRDIADPREVVVGKHGLVVAMGDRRGLLLPQVPAENGWDRDTYLEQGCLKAGLPKDAWRRGAKLGVFEAIVFHE